MRMKKSVTIFILFSTLLLCWNLPSSAKERTDSLNLKVYFRQDVSQLDLYYRDNEASLKRFVSDVKGIMADPAYRIQDFYVRSGASPEGKFDHNKELSLRRGQAIKDYLQRALNLPSEKIKVVSVGEDWASFRELVVKADFPDKAKVLAILDSHADYINGTPISVIGGPKKDLMDLNGGRTWWWLLDNIYPDLRSAGNSVYCHYTYDDEVVAQATDAADAAAANAANVADDAAAANADDAATKAIAAAAVPVGIAATVGAVDAAADANANANADAAEMATTAPEYIRRPLFAVKTNLLFDAATAVNAAIEIPIGQRFSLEGEWVFPDWVDRTTNKYCLQSNIKSVEFRTWLGNRVGKDMTGHFLGVYGQWGDFDFQPFTEQGYRCYDGWAAGLSYGFSHAINKSKTLRLEYSLGVGYVYGNYCKYQRELDGAIIATKDDWHYKTSLFPIPTKAKISLVWMIYYKEKVR